MMLRAVAATALLGLLLTGCSDTPSLDERVAANRAEARENGPTEEELAANARANAAARDAAARERKARREARASRPEPAPEPPPAPDANLAEVALPTVVREQYPGVFDNVPDANLNEVARLICDGFDVGLTFEENLANAVSSGIPEDPAAFVIGAATVGFCPEHDAKVP